MVVPDGLLYTKEHEWAKIEGSDATVGVSDYAQHSLGDITFVELPKLEAKVVQSKFLATVESVKAASDVYAPVTGTVIKINETLQAHPESINQSPFEKGWFAVIRIENPAELKNLMSAGEYKKYLEGLTGA